MPRIVVPLSSPLPEGATTNPSGSNNASNTTTANRSVTAHTTAGAVTRSNSDPPAMQSRSRDVSMHSLPMYNTNTTTVINTNNNSMTGNTNVNTITTVYTATNINGDNATTGGANSSQHIGSAQRSGKRNVIYDYSHLFLPTPYGNTTTTNNNFVADNMEDSTFTASESSVHSRCASPTPQDIAFMRAQLNTQPSCSADIRNNNNFNNSAGMNANTAHNAQQNTLSFHSPSSVQYPPNRNNFSNNNNGSNNNVPVSEFFGFPPFPGYNSSDVNNNNNSNGSRVRSSGVRHDPYGSTSSYNPTNNSSRVMMSNNNSNKNYYNNNSAVDNSGTFYSESNPGLVNNNNNNTYSNNIPSYYNSHHSELFTVFQPNMMNTSTKNLSLSSPRMASSHNAANMNSNHNNNASTSFAHPSQSSREITMNSKTNVTHRFYNSTATTNKDLITSQSVSRHASPSPPPYQSYDSNPKPMNASVSDYNMNHRHQQHPLNEYDASTYRQESNNFNNNNNMYNSVQSNTTGRGNFNSVYSKQPSHFNAYDAVRREGNTQIPVESRNSYNYSNDHSSTPPPQMQMNNSNHNVFQGDNYENTARRNQSNYVSNIGAYESAHSSTNRLAGAINNGESVPTKAHKKMLHEEVANNVRVSQKVEGAAGKEDSKRKKNKKKKKKNNTFERVPDMPPLKELRYLPPPPPDCERLLQEDCLRALRGSKQGQKGEGVDAEEQEDLKTLLAIVERWYVRAVEAECDYIYNNTNSESNSLSSDVDTTNAGARLNHSDASSNLPEGEQQQQLQQQQMDVEKKGGEVPVECPRKKDYRILFSGPANESIVCRKGLMQWAQDLQQWWQCYVYPHTKVPRHQLSPTSGAANLPEERSTDDLSAARDCSISQTVSQQMSLPTVSGADATRGCSANMNILEKSTYSPNSPNLVVTARITQWQSVSNSMDAATLNSLQSCSPNPLTSDVVACAGAKAKHCVYVQGNGNLTRSSSTIAVKSGRLHDGARSKSQTTTTTTNNSNNYSDTEGAATASTRSSTANFAHGNHHPIDPCDGVECDTTSIYSWPRSPNVDQLQ